MAFTSSLRRSSLRAKLAVLFVLALSAAFIPAARADAAVTYYQVRARHSGKCAEIPYNFNDGVLARQRFCFAGEPKNQYWRLKPTDPGWFEIRSWATDKCLGVRAGSYDDGALIHQWFCNGARSQQWRRVMVEPGWWQFRAQHSGKCLDVRFGSFADWASLQQWQCGAQLQQQWRLT